jgi:DNA-binding MarR family transcriptional regulator
VPTPLSYQTIVIKEINSQVTTLSLSMMKSGLWSLKGKGISRARLRILELLLQEGVLSLRVMAESLGLAKQSVHEQVCILKSGGWIEQVENPMHRQGRLYRLKKSGRKRLSPLLKHRRYQYVRMGRALGREDLVSCAEALEQIVGVTWSLRK